MYAFVLSGNAATSLSFNRDCVVGDGEATSGARDGRPSSFVKPFLGTRRHVSRSTENSVGKWKNQKTYSSGKPV